MIKATINAGVCGLITVVNVDGDMMNTTVDIISDCPHIQKIAEELKEISPMEEIFSKFNTSKVYVLAAKHCQHLACPVPCGIIKAVETAGGLALPKDPTIELVKE